MRGLALVAARVGSTRFTHGLQLVATLFAAAIQRLARGSHALDIRGSTIGETRRLADEGARAYAFVPSRDAAPDGRVQFLIAGGETLPRRSSRLATCLAAGIARAGFASGIDQLLAALNTRLGSLARIREAGLRLGSTRREAFPILETVCAARGIIATATVAQSECRQRESRRHCSHQRHTLDHHASLLGT
ncbi:MAG: hypothetical protein AB7P78_07780 [Candidatus Binatia bacterium]